MSSYADSGMGEGLVRHREFPELPLDNNTSERALRGPVVGRKNFYGSGSKASAELAGRVWTITATAERAGLTCWSSWAPTSTPAPRPLAHRPPARPWTDSCPGRPTPTTTPPGPVTPTPPEPIPRANPRASPDPPPLPPLTSTGGHPPPVDRRDLRTLDVG